MESCKGGQRFDKLLMTLNLKVLVAICYSKLHHCRTMKIAWLTCCYVCLVVAKTGKQIIHNGFMSLLDFELFQAALLSKRDVRVKSNHRQHIESALFKTSDSLDFSENIPH